VIQIFEKVTSCLQSGALKSRALLTITYCISAISAISVATASETHTAHTHGVASLTLAFERGALEVEFESPAMSILGFEHKPSTQTQIDSVEKSKALFKSAEQILSIDGANCSLESAAVDIHGPAGQVIDHDDEHHHSHQDSEGTDHEQNESHSEVSATYTFDCVGDEAVRSVTVLLFEHFSGLEKIKVNWVTEAKQGQAILRPKSSRVELR